MQRVVVGVDGSENSRRALVWALDEAHVRNACLDVVHTWEAPHTSSGSGLWPVAGPYWAESVRRAGNVAARPDDHGHVRPRILPIPIDAVAVHGLGREGAPRRPPEERT